MDKIKSIAVPVKRPNAVAGAMKRRQRGAEDSDVIVEFRRQPPQTAARPIHRYEVGQRLAMARGSRDIARAASVCEVVALLPHEAGPLLYRVRSDTEGHERIVDEIDLAPLP